MSMSRQIGDRSVFDRTHGPAVGASGDGLEGAYSAILNSAPSAGTVKVIVPNLWGLTTVRTAVCSAAFAGSPGDRVLVMFDEEKQPWVISPTGVSASKINGTPVPLTGSAWIVPTLLNSWVATSSAVGYMKDPLGLVHLRGRVTAGASGTVLFNLPAGFRPGNGNDTYPAASFNGTTAASAFVYIPTTTVNLYYSAGGGDVGISGISFLAEN
jgi:hypothetical protein